jgi:hypothetical protein
MSSWINVAKKEPGKKRNSRSPTEREDDAAIVSDDSVSTISERGEANLAQEEVERDDVVLDANREVRVKLFVGSVRQLSLAFGTGYFIGGNYLYRSPWAGYGSYPLSTWHAAGRNPSTSSSRGSKSTSPSALAHGS